MLLHLDSDALYKKSAIEYFVHVLHLLSKELVLVEWICLVYGIEEITADNKGVCVCVYS